MNALARESRRKSLTLLRERGDVFITVGWCASDNVKCRMCRESMRDVISLSRERAPSGEEFVLRKKTEVRVCLRCSNVHGSDIEGLTGVVTADMPLQDFLNAAVAHSVLSK